MKAIAKTEFVYNGERIPKGGEVEMSDASYKSAVQRNLVEKGKVEKEMIAPKNREMKPTKTKSKVKKKKVN